MKKIFIIIVLLIKSIFLFSQTGLIITKQIIDKEKEEPLPFAHILVKKYSTGTFSDENGYFTLSLPKTSINDTITISFIGYETLKLKISNIKSENIKLTPKTNMIEEVAIIANYNIKKILKKVHKNIKKNYPLKAPYCAKTFYREYIKKDSLTVQMFEANISVKEKGTKLKYHKYSQFNIDTINYFYRLDYNYYWGNLMFMLLVYDEPYTPSDKGKYNIDSVFFENNEKYISITYIPKNRDTIVYDKYETIKFQNGKEIIIQSEHKMKKDKSYQYSYSSHYIINLKDYAITEYSFSYNLLGKPIRFSLKIMKEYPKSKKMFVRYEKKGDKYYVKRIYRNTEDVFVSKYNIDKELYTLKIFKEFRFNEVKTDCINNVLTPSHYYKTTQFIEKYKNKIHPSTIDIFEDNIKQDYLKDIKKENIIKLHTTTNKPNAQ